MPDNNFKADRFTNIQDSKSCLSKRYLSCQAIIKGSVLPFFDKIYRIAVQGRGKLKLH